jgi:hypothetical protein
MVLVYLKHPEFLNKIKMLKDHYFGMEGEIMKHTSKHIARGFTIHKAYCTQYSISLTIDGRAITV